MNKVIKIMQEFFHLTIPYWWVFLFLKKICFICWIYIIPRRHKVYILLDTFLFHGNSAKIISTANPIQLQVLGGNSYAKCVFLFLFVLTKLEEVLRIIIVNRKKIIVCT